MLKAVAWRELKIKVADTASTLLPAVFFLIVLVLFPLAIGADKAKLEPIGGSAVWIAALLSSLLSGTYVFSEDVRAGHLEQVVIARISLTLWVMVKLTVNWLLSGFLLCVMSFLVVPLFDVSINQSLWLAATLLLGTPVLLMFCALAGSLTLSLPTANALVPIIALPLMLPVVIFSLSVLSFVDLGLNPLPPLALLAAISLAAIICLPWVIAQSLKLALTI